MKVTRALAWILVAGAVLWLVKLAQIVANGGSNTDEGMVGLSYVVGVLLLLVGSSSVGLWLARRRPIAVRTAAGVVAVAGFLASYVLVEAALQALIDDAGPSYARDEVGILAAAVLWLVLGIVVLKRTSRDQLAPAAAEAN